MAFYCVNPVEGRTFFIVRKEDAAAEIFPVRPPRKGEGADKMPKNKTQGIIFGIICQLLRQAGTVAIMCPTMSLATSILFNVILAGAPLAQLPTIWIGTLLKNFPMAFFWNMFAAAPFTHWLFGKIYPDRR